jgi:peroxiredoxin
LSQLRQRSSELRERQVSVAVVTFEQLWLAEAYVAETRIPWPLLIDADRKLFAAYDMDRGSTFEVMGFAAWKVYLSLLLRGQRLKRPTDDIYQLGGDVVIDPTGTVRLHHVGRGPADRPSVDQLLAVVAEFSVPPRSSQ